MPYAVRKSGDKWLVVKKEKPGHVLGTHPSHEKAMAQVRAIYAHEHAASHPRR